ncbi:MAG TPA: hypothetical protein VJR47_21125 [Stellaceae bacterium]|nr:hypothetical protein [Stellaceae bacterium]
MRVVTLVWGDQYVDDLLAFTIPALLGPGNVPALAEHFDCEVVVVTETRLFDRILTSAIISELLKHAHFRLMPIDDLLTSHYGITLTYAYVRGFADLGEAMTKTHLVFLNGDFLVADGSYRTLGKKILAGERLVVAPSYCVVSESAMTKVLTYRDPMTGIVAVPRREMAAIIIADRHNTIRAKTANQRLFRIHRYDQFYWYVDDSTLLARQMPIAIVYMRPERVLPELPTFWDYGAISEYCPTVTPCVLSDSDEFLMAEMRQEGTFADLLHLGWPTPAEIAADLSSFTTKDHRDYGRYVLKLHSDELPSQIDVETARFQAFIDDVDDRLGPAIDYRNHPFWMNSFPHFKASADEKRLKLIHGIENRYNDQIDGPQLERLRQIDKLEAQIDEQLRIVTQEADSKILSLRAQRAAIEAECVRKCDLIDYEIAQVEEESRLKLNPLSEVRSEYQLERQALIEPGLISLSTDETGDPIGTAAAVAELAGLENTARPKTTSEKLIRFCAKLYRRCFGRLTSTTPWHPFHAPLQHARAAVQRRVKPAPRVLVLSSGTIWGQLLAACLGTEEKHLSIPPQTLLLEAYADDLIGDKKFDLIICDLAFSDLVQFRVLMDRIRSLAEYPARVVLFHLNESLRSLDQETFQFTRSVFPLTGRSRACFTGNLPGKWAMQWWRRALQRFDASTLRGLLGLLAALLICAPLARLASSREIKRNPEALPRACTSLTIEIDLLS